MLLLILMAATHFNLVGQVQHCSSWMYKRWTQEHFVKLLSVNTVHILRSDSLTFYTASQLLWNQACTIIITITVILILSSLLSLASCYEESSISGAALLVFKAFELSLYNIKVLVVLWMMHFHHPSNNTRIVVIIWLSTSGI